MSEDTGTTSPAGAGPTVNFQELASPAAHGRADPDKIAPSAVLRSVRHRFEDARRRMMLCSAAAGDAMGPSLSPGELAIALAVLRFAQKNEDIARAAKVPVDTLRLGLRLYQSLDTLDDGVGYFARRARQGGVILGAAISADLAAVEEDVAERKADPDLPPEERRPLSLFASVENYRARLKGRSERWRLFWQRRRKAHQAALGAAQQQRQTLLQIEQMKKGRLPGETG